MGMKQRRSGLIAATIAVALAAGRLDGREDRARVGVEPDPVDGRDERRPAVVAQVAPEAGLAVRVRAVEPVEADA